VEIWERIGMEWIGLIERNGLVFMIEIGIARQGIECFCVLNNTTLIDNQISPLTK